MDRVDFFLGVGFWQKVKKEIIYLTPSNKKNPWIRGQIAISFEPGVIPLPKPQIGVTSCEVVIICPEWLVCINGSWWFQHVSELIWKKNTLDPFCRKYLNLGLETKTTTISFLNYRQAKLGGTHFLQQQKLESSHPPRGLMVFILTFRCFFIVTVGKYIPNCQTVVKDGDVPW